MRTDADKEWSQGVIIDRHESPRSYLVDNGHSVVRRNRVHLKPDHSRRFVTPADDVDALYPTVGDTVVSDSPPTTNTIPVTPATPQRSPAPVVKSQPRGNRGVLPVRFKDFQM